MGWLQFLAGMFIKHSTVIYLVPSMLTVNATQFINGNILTWGGGRKLSTFNSISTSNARGKCPFLFWIGTQP